MSKVLVVNAHALSSNESRTLKTLETFLATYKEVNPNDEIEVVNLYESNFPEINKDMFSAWNKLGQGVNFTDLTETEQYLVSSFNQSTEQFLNADKVVVANALWNLSVPTRLKAWIDTINVAGKTFKYTQEGPVGLAKGKKVVHIQSAGGFYNNQDLSSVLVKTAFNFIGVEDFTKIAIDGLDANPQEATNMFNAILEDVKTIARNF